MKKLSTYLFLILFSFSAPSFAEDLSNIQIEGMSIGDKISDHFNTWEIKNLKKGTVNVFMNDFSNVKYIITSSKFKTYDEVVILSRLRGPNVTFSKSDEILSLHGIIYLKRNIVQLKEYRTSNYDLEQCRKIRKEIANEFEKNLKHLVTKQKYKSQLIPAKVETIFHDEDLLKEYREYYWVSKIIFTGQNKKVFLFPEDDGTFTKVDGIVQDKVTISCFNFHELSKFKDFMRVALEQKLPLSILIKQRQK